jgi:hypothetical protein
MSDMSITKYSDLIRTFLNDEIDAQTFERSYLSLFKNEQSFLPPDAFRVLDGLFADVDAFCPDPELRGDEDLNEQQLRDRCAGALKRLRL